MEQELERDPAFYEQDIINAILDMADKHSREAALAAIQKALTFIKE
jgi:hypothetical protein